MKFAVKPLVPDEVYTDRQEYLDYFYRYALLAAERRAMSTVLLGQRRMGKTEIFKRVVNRLFFEQDHNDPKAVVPVWYSFPDVPKDRETFALEYTENFIRWYAAFRMGKAGFISEDIKREELIHFIREKLPVSKGFNNALECLRVMMSGDMTSPEHKALMLPRTVSDWDDSTVVMFLDEFQNTHLPQYNFNIVGYFHESVESPTCPHFVTGLAMSILSNEILGRGTLFGRFDADPIKTLTEYWGAELARKAARYYKAEVPDTMAPVLSDRCGGNPFYITAVIRQAAKQGKAVDSEDSLNRLLAVDLSSGFIWGELSDQVSRWIARINDQGITKWVLYLSALGEGELIDPAEIQRLLAQKDMRHAETKDIREILIRLSRGDLLEYRDGADWFRRTDDPILLDFLRVWGKSLVEGQSPESVQQDIIKEYATLKRRVHDQKGYLAEVWLTQILWNGQGKTFPGKYFHSASDVTFPDRFRIIRQRVRLGAAAESEIDIYAFADTAYWICESKWWENRKVGADTVKEFLVKAEKLKDFEGRKYFGENGPFDLKLWLFAHSGVTDEAEDMLRSSGIYWSDRADLDWLIAESGLRKLPV
ncbi:MAG: hypothetical protein R2941_23620 [Desulfobacterales bacterium]